MPQLNQQFQFTVPITGYQIRKDANGVDKYYIQGMASNTDLDLTGERMASSAIDAMVRSFQTHPVAINNEHSSDWDADFGELTKAWATPDKQFMVEAELNPDNYRTQTLIKGLEKGKRLGLSIGGIVKDAALEWWDDIQQKVLTYKDIDIFHVAITGTPAVANTWVGNIHKSVKNLSDLPVTKAADWKCGAARDLPVIDGSWDGQEAKDSIFAWAGWPDNPDSDKAKQAFLAYDASNPDLKGSYKLPFARVEDGQLKAVSAGIANAASRLPQTDIPASVQDEARAVLDAYENKEHPTKSMPESLDVTKEADITAAEAAAPVQEAPASEPIPAPTEVAPEAPATEETPVVAVNETKTTPELDTTPAQPAEEEPTGSDTPAAEEQANQPVAAAAGQEEVVTATDESAAATPAPDQANADTSEVSKTVTKSDYLGEYAEASMTYGAVGNLADSLLMALCDAVADDDMTPEQQIAAVEAMLQEFHDLVVTMTTALIQADAKEDAAETVKAVRASLRPTLTKSLTAQASELETVKKSLADVTQQLEDTRQALTEAETKVNRKAMVFTKYDEPETGAVDSESDPEEAYKKAFAAFALTGSK